MNSCLKVFFPILTFLLMFHIDTINEGNARPSPNCTTENLVASNEDDAGEYTSLKDTRAATKPVNDGSEQPLLKSDSEGSTSGSESAIGALYARIARLSKNSKEEEDNSTAETKASDKATSPEKTKPRPPDPSTKPKVSWIHGTSGAIQTEKSQAPSPPKEKKRTTKEVSEKGEEKHRSKEKSSRKCEQRNQDSKVDGNDSHKAHKASDPIEHINGAVQNALKKIGNFHSDRKGSDTTKEPPKSPKIMHPHINSEAATLLAAQLKEKTQSLNRNEGLSVGIKPNGVSTPQANREKPTPPQKAKRSVTGANKPLLPTSNNLQKMMAPVTDSSTPEPQSPETQAINGTQIGDAGDATPKKTPIKKPPRKKGKETTSETETKITPKMAIMPPQIVK